MGPGLLWGKVGMGTHVPLSRWVAQVGGAGCPCRVTLLVAGMRPGPGTAGPRLGSAGCQPGLSLRHQL